MSRVVVATTDVAMRILHDTATASLVASISTWDIIFPPIFVVRYTRVGVSSILPAIVAARARKVSRGLLARFRTAQKSRKETSVQTIPDLFRIGELLDPIPIVRSQRSQRRPTRRLQFEDYNLERDKRTGALATYLGCLRCSNPSWSATRNRPAFSPSSWGLAAMRQRDKRNERVTKQREQGRL